MAEDPDPPKQESLSNAPAAAVTLLGDFASRWRLQTNDLSGIRTALGGDLFAAFCSSFVQSDRLASLAQLLLLNSQHVDRTSVAHGRNRLTVLWLLAGTLREMASAIRGLRSAWARRGWLDLHLEPFKKLRDFESRWEEDSLYLALRNTGAFHVDANVIRTGVEALVSQPGSVIIAEGVGGTDHEMSLSIGAEALLLGVHPERAALWEALRSIHADHKIYLTLRELFVLALQKVDISLDQEDWPQR